jgi:hypothetical protein
MICLFVMMMMMMMMMIMMMMMMMMMMMYSIPSLADPPRPSYEAVELTRLDMPEGDATDFGTEATPLEWQPVCAASVAGHNIMSEGQPWF